MVDRFSLWLGAGVVAAGVTVGMLAGAGTAHAQTESGSATTARRRRSRRNPLRTNRIRTRTRSSQDQQPNQTRQRRQVDNDPAVGRAGPDAKVDRDSVKDDVTEERGRKTPKSEVGKRTAKLINNVVVAVTHKPDSQGRGREGRPRRKVDPAVTTDPVDAVETESTITRLSGQKQPKAEPLQTPAIAQTDSRFARAPPTDNGHHAGDSAAESSAATAASHRRCRCRRRQRDRHRGLRPDLIRGERV